MANINVGRVQGASIFYTSMVCTPITTNIDVSTLSPSNMQCFVGDKILCSTGEVFNIIAVDSVITVEYITSLKGADGSVIQVCDCVGNVGTYDTESETAIINGIKYHITGEATCEIVGFDADSSNGNLTLGFILVYGYYYAVTKITSDGAIDFNNDTILTVDIINEITIEHTSDSSHFLYSCSSLTSVTINAPVTYNGSYEYSSSYFISYCSSLTSVTINAPVTCNDSYFIYSCSSLTSVTINAPVTCTGTGGDGYSSHFIYSCSSLTSVTINAPVTYTGYSEHDSLISSCSSLALVIINAPVTCNKSADIFSSCTSLRAIYILTYGDITISDGSKSFYNCTKLTDVYYVGTEMQRQSNINVYDNYGYFTNATWHYESPSSSSSSSSSLSLYVGNTDDNKCLIDIFDGTEDKKIAIDPELGKYGARMFLDHIYGYIVWNDLGLKLLFQFSVFDRGTRDKKIGDDDNVDIPSAYGQYEFYDGSNFNAWLSYMFSNTSNNAGMVNEMFYSYGSKTHGGIHYPFNGILIDTKTGELIGMFNSIRVAFPDTCIYGVGWFKKYIDTDGSVIDVSNFNLIDDGFPLFDLDTSFTFYDATIRGANTGSVDIYYSWRYQNIPCEDCGGDVYTYM